MKTKHPVHIKVFGAVTSDGDFIPPITFPHGLTVNIEANIKCLEEVVLTWNEMVAAGRFYIW